MKLSISLPDEDVATLDEYVRSSGLPSRSAAVRRAVRLLRAEDVEAAYEAAFDEWRSDPDRSAWDAMAGDGLSDASR